MLYTSKDVRRFLSKIDKSQGDKGCWIWTAYRNEDGYGIFHFSVAPRGRKPGITGGAKSGAHRFSWMWHNNQEIPEGMKVLHRCDTPACVNPYHLFLGTDLDNKWDSIKKGRTVYDPDFCPKGHPFDEENTYYHPNGSKICRVCRRMCFNEGNKGRRVPKTHCKHGHTMTEENTRITLRGYRRCRTCDRATEERRAVREHNPVLKKHIERLKLRLQHEGRLPG